MWKGSTITTPNHVANMGRTIVEQEGCRAARKYGSDNYYIVGRKEGVLCIFQDQTICGEDIVVNYRDTNMTRLIKKN